MLMTIQPPPNQHLPDFEEWYKSSYPRMVAALTVVTRDPDAAQDCLQDALVKAMEQWNHVSEMENPDGWLYTVALNTHRRSHRRKAVLNRLLQRSSCEVLIAASFPSAVELWPLVHALPDRQRIAVALRHLGHLKEPEIAQVMDVSRGTVSSTLRTAYTKLRDELTNHEELTGELSKKERQWTD